MEWINVKNRLPPKGETVLLYTSGGHITQGGYYEERWVNQGKELECGSIHYGESPCHATHWMPLPEKPSQPIEENVKHFNTKCVACNCGHPVISLQTDDCFCINCKCK